MLLRCGPQRKYKSIRQSNKYNIYTKIQTKVKVYNKMWACKKNKGNKKPERCMKAKEVAPRKLEVEQEKIRAKGSICRAT